MNHQKTRSNPTQPANPSKSGKLLPRLLLGGGVVFLFLLSALTANPGGYRQSGEPTFTVRSREIAFTSRRDGNAQIFFFTLDELEPRKISNNLFNDIQPSWSPEGDQVVFVSDRDGNNQVCVMDADGSSQRCLTDRGTVDKKSNPALPEDGQPIWSPDGSHIAFVTNQDGNKQIYVMSTDGSNVLNISNNVANEDQPAWSPDLKTIAFVSDRTGNRNVCIMDGSGYNQRCLTNNRTPNRTYDPSRPEDYFPTWSPDSQKIAFVSTRDKNQEIYVMNADGSNPVNLTQNIAADGMPAWSPDGRYIIFTSNREGSSDLYIMNAEDGSDQRPLTVATLGGDYDPVWQPLPPDPNATPTQTLTPTPGGTPVFTPLFRTPIGVTVTPSITPTTSGSSGGSVTPPPINIVPLMSGNTGILNQPTTWPLSAIGGQAPYTFTVQTTNLPPGMNFDPGTNTITGTPTTPGTYTFSVTAIDANGRTGTRTFTVSIMDIIPPSPIPTAQAGEVYPSGVQFSATGGTPGYTFSLAGGTLPVGMSIQPDGTLGGTPSQPGQLGTFTFNVRVTDSVNFSIVETFSITVVPGPPATITVVSGDDQPAEVGQPFAEPLVALVRDSLGNPVGAGINVIFQAPGAGASAQFGGASSDTVATDATGRATSIVPNANTLPGTYDVFATVVGSPSVTTAPGGFTLTNTVGPPGAVQIVSGNLQSVTVNNPFANLEVLVVDGFGNPIGNVTVTFNVVTGATGAAGIFSYGTGSSVTALTDNSPISLGTAVVPASGQTFTANSVAGIFTVTATVPGATSATFTLTNNADVPTQLVFVQQPSNTIAGDPITPNIQVAIQDAYGNTSTTYTGNIALTIENNPSSGVLRPPAATTVTTVNGVAIFGGLLIQEAGVGYTLRASTTVNILGIPTPLTGISSAFTITPDAPDNMIITRGDNQTAVVGGAAFGQRLRVKVQDQFNNGIPGQLVQFFLPPNTNPSGTLDPAITPECTTGVNGECELPADYRTNTIAGPNNVNAATSGSVPNVALPSPFNLTNAPGAPNSIIANSGTPQNATVGTPYTAQLCALVRDQYLNPINNVGVTFTEPPAGASVTFTSPNPVNTNPGGIACVSISANTLPGTFDVTANLTVSPLGTPATFTLTNNIGAPNSIIANSGTPQNATVGTPYTAQLCALVRDQYLNPINNVGVTFTAPAAGASVTFTSPNPTNTNPSGIACASVTANTIAGTFNVTANLTVSPLGTPATFTLTNNPDVPNSIIANSGTPQTATVGTPYTAQLCALVRDQYLNPINNVGVTFTAPAAGASVTFTSPNPTNTNPSGIACVTVTANAIAGAFDVTANLTVSPLGTPATFTLTNNPGAAATIEVDSGDPQSRVVNTAYAQLCVRVLDSGGNGVNNLVVTFTAPATGASVTFPSGNTDTTNGSGRACVNATANTNAGSFTVTANITPPLATPATFNLTNLPSAANNIIADSGTPQNATVGSAYSQTLCAKVQDAFGNGIVSQDVQFVTPISGASVSLNPAAPITTDANGLACVTATANGTSGSFTVMANRTVSPFATPADFDLTNDPGAAATITYVSGSPQNTPINTAFGAALCARVEDSFGNDLSGIDVTFNGPGSGAGIDPNPVSDTTNASGVACVSVTANNTSGSFTVDADLTVSPLGAPATYNLTNDPPTPAAIFADSGDGQNTTVNTAYSAQLCARVEDSLGNGLSGIDVTFTAPNAGASIDPDTASDTTDINGIACVDVTANTIAGSFTVGADLTTSPLGAPAMFSLTNDPDVPASITPISGSPQNTTVGTAFSAALCARVEDTFGNPLSGVDVTFNGPGSGAGIDPNPVSDVTDASGAVCVNVTANTTDGAYVVDADLTTSPLGIPASFNLTNDP